MELELGPLRFGVIGAGKLGLALARTLQAKEFEVVHVSSASAAGRDRATKVLGVPAHEDPLAVCELVDCVLLCVPDDSLDATVARIAERAKDASPMQLRIVSTSAPGGVAALAPLAALGHSVCVLHPVTSVTQIPARAGVFVGAGAAVGADDDASRTLAHGLAHALDMHPFDLPEDAWSLHAAACTVAANLTLLALGLAEALADHAELHESVARGVYGRLATSAIGRFEHSGADAALAGPVVRGDAHAVATQLRAVRTTSPQHEQFFAAALRLAATRAVMSGRIDMATQQAVVAAVTETMGDE